MSTKGREQSHPSGVLLIRALEDNIMDGRETDHTIAQVPKGLIAFGIVLILSGAFIALFVAQEVLRVYVQWGENSFIRALADQFKNADIFIMGGDSLAITEQGALIIAFVLFVLLALLGVHIATALIRAGAHIVSPAFPYQLAQLKLRIASLREKVESK